MAKRARADLSVAAVELRALNKTSTLRELSRHIGVDPTLLSHYMAGRKKPSLNSAWMIERRVGIEYWKWLIKS